MAKSKQPKSLRILKEMFGDKLTFKADEGKDNLVICYDGEEMVILTREMILHYGLYDVAIERHVSILSSLIYNYLERKIK